MDFYYVKCILEFDFGQALQTTEVSPQNASQFIAWHSVGLGCGGHFTAARLILITRFLTLKFINVTTNLCCDHII